MKRVTLPKPEEVEGGHSGPTATGPSSEQDQLVSVPAPALPNQQPANVSAKLPSHQRERGDLLPPEIMAIMSPSLQVGAAFGTLGLVTGIAAGIMRSAPPALFSLVMGGQWFALSSSFYASRMVALNAFRGNQEPRPVDKVKASSIAGGIAGVVGGALRGPKNIIPGMIFFSLFGCAGQYAANAVDWTPRSEPISKGILQSRWSPVTFLSDEEYEKILEEKLLRVEAEIAIVDDNIRDLRAAEEARPPPTNAQD